MVSVPSSRHRPSCHRQLRFDLSNPTLLKNGIAPTPIPGAFAMPWILPRPKKHATGMFFTPALLGSASSNPTPRQQKMPPVGGISYWRRVRDSNPRFLSESPVFKTGSLNRSDNSPDTEKPPYGGFCGGVRGI